jgi:hypothetical protein
VLREKKDMKLEKFYELVEEEKKKEAKPKELNFLQRLKKQNSKDHSKSDSKLDISRLQRFATFSSSNRRI